MRNLFVSVLILFGLFACLMVLSRSAADPTGQPADPVADEAKGRESDRLQDQAARHFLRGDYEPAARCYRQVVEEEPDDSLAWVRLAYATHELGDFEAALPLHERAADFPENRISSLFKLGCALARLGRVDEAISAIGQAIEEGYRDRSRAEAEEDLAEIRDDARFRILLNRMAPPPPGRAPLDILVGHWVVRESESGEISGFSSLTRVEQSHVYQEQWNLFEENRFGRGMAFLDPERGDYELIRVDDQGEVHRLRGSLDGGPLRLDGERILASGRSTGLRVDFEPFSDGRIRRVFSESQDGGESWSTLSESMLVPQEPAWRVRGGR